MRTGVWTPNYKDSTFITAVEQLRKAWLKREQSTHVVIIPRLMTPEWKKQLLKLLDLFLELPFDNVWKKDDQHEPLTTAFIFPFLSFKPWQLKKVPNLFGNGSCVAKNVERE